ncbi:MAG: SdiA-regulated domain-containing protein, partial [Bacteroidetes bacterium]|nr:SdiA-regulated domain-containing protein [Bacteroidota bacterium]
PLEEESKKFLKALGNKNLTEVIKPSAMAYHPLSGNLYVLSSINHIIVVLDQQGKFLKVIPFIGKEFRQPEGISFNSKGELYVSNEGRNVIGNIIKIKELDVK